MPKKSKMINLRNRRKQSHLLKKLSLEFQSICHRQSIYKNDIAQSKTEPALIYLLRIDCSYFLDGYVKSKMYKLML